MKISIIKGFVIGFSTLVLLAISISPRVATPVQGQSTEPNQLTPEEKAQRQAGAGFAQAYTQAFEESRAAEQAALDGEGDDGGGGSCG